MDTIDLGREVDTINEARKTQGMTIRELSDASGVPLATVQRILSHTAKNPSHQAIGSLQAALGLTQPEEEPPKLPDAEGDKDEQLIALYRYQLERQRRDYETSLKDQAREYRLREARFRRRCFRQEIIIGVLVAFIIAVLLYDAFNGSIGFIRYMQSFWESAKHIIKNML